MNEVLNVIEHGGKQAVNARDLHAALEVGRDFSTWIKERVEKYGFVEGDDYEKFDHPDLGNQTGNLNFPKSGENQVEKKWGGKREGAGRHQADYFLSLGMAKELAMVENNEKGRAGRLYLIKVKAA
jgi:phage anti-repressor protein